jgi:hypothetical protein
MPPGQRGQTRRSSRNTRRKSSAQHAAGAQQIEIEEPAPSSSASAGSIRAKGPRMDHLVDDRCRAAPMARREDGASPHVTPGAKPPAAGMDRRREPPRTAENRRVIHPRALRCAHPTASPQLSAGSTHPIEFRSLLGHCNATMIIRHAHVVLHVARDEVHCMHQRATPGDIAAAASECSQTIDINFLFTEEGTVYRPLRKHPAGAGLSTPCWPPGQAEDCANCPKMRTGDRSIVN